MHRRKKALYLFIIVKDGKDYDTPRSLQRWTIQPVIQLNPVSPPFLAATVMFNYQNISYGLCDLKINVN